MYGQTEATSRMIYLPHEFSITKLGSMGIVIPDGEFSLLDNNGNIIEENEKEVSWFIEGKMFQWAMLYLRPIFLKMIKTRVLLTGDIAKRDHDGY